MRRIYDLITKANQVLLFLVMLGGTALILYTIYESSRHRDPPHVSVAQTAEEAKKSMVEDVVFLGQSSGLYVLGLRKHVVKIGEEPWNLRSTSHLGNEEMLAGEMVNVVFSKGEKRLRALLPNDGLVLSHTVPGEYCSEKMKALLFRCVTEDTDGNHRLDASDRNDLYVTFDSENPDLVVKGILDFQVISLTHLAVKTGERNAPQFWDIDTETQVKKEIAWK